MAQYDVADPLTLPRWNVAPGRWHAAEMQAPGNRTLKVVRRPSAFWPPRGVAGAQLEREPRADSLGHPPMGTVIAARADRAIHVRQESACALTPATDPGLELQRRTTRWDHINASSCLSRLSS